MTAKNVNKKKRAPLSRFRNLNGTSSTADTEKITNLIIGGGFT